MFRGKIAGEYREGEGRSYSKCESSWLDCQEVMNFRYWFQKLVGSTELLIQNALHYLYSIVLKGFMHNVRAPGTQTIHTAVDHCYCYNRKWNRFKYISVSSSSVAISKKVLCGHITEPNLLRTTNWWKMKGKTSIKCLSMESGHHKLPEDEPLASTRYSLIYTSNLI